MYWSGIKDNKEGYIYIYWSGIKDNEEGYTPENTDYPNSSPGIGALLRYTSSYQTKIFIMVKYAQLSIFGVEGNLFFGIIWKDVKLDFLRLFTPKLIPIPFLL